MVTGKPGAVNWRGNARRTACSDLCVVYTNRRRSFYSPGRSRYDRHYWWPLKLLFNIYPNAPINSFATYFTHGVYPFTLFELIAYAVEGEPPQDLDPGGATAG